MPTNPRPAQLGRWFKIGRRLGHPNNIPEIESVQVFEDEWVNWWVAGQPGWRDTSSWPFAQEDALGCDWGDLPNGGKDGLFLVLVSLGWWVHARDPSEGSKVDEAIADVAWVIKNLVSALAAGAASDSDSEPDSSSPPPPSKRRSSLRIHPPTKRAKRTHA